jgi:ABC-type lipoprotein export system ATPase subunit
VDLEVREGEFLAVVGASGSGKSTLLHMLGGVDTVTAGEIVVCGYDLGGGLGDRVLSRYRSEVIGFVFQFFYLQPYLSVAKNLEVPLMLTGMSGGDRLKLVGEVAGLVGMDGKLKSYPGALSGGEMQRVAIARAVIGGPRVILADEPTGNLDRVNGGKIAELLDQIRREKKTTLIVVTHDEEIAGMADRVVRMKDGVLIDD